MPATPDGAVLGLMEEAYVQWQAVGSVFRRLECCLLWWILDIFLHYASGHILGASLA